MSRKKNVHVHTYYKSFLGPTYKAGTRKSKKERTVVWRCKDPNCSHYRYTHDVLGRTSLCNKCGGVFDLPKVEYLLDTYPVCKICRDNRKKSKIVIPKMLEDRLNAIANGEGTDLDKLEERLYREAYLGNPHAIDTLLKREFSKGKSAEYDEPILVVKDDETQP